jgi:hypothetical protein
VVAHTEDQFTQAENDWDLERLYNDLTSVKGKNLTRIEKLHLRGLLCGHSPTEIAEILHRDVRGLEVNLCKNLYKYVKTIVNREQERIENWRSICQWLEEAGYKAQKTNQSQSNNSIPVDTKVHIEKISVENNKIEICMNTQIIINTQLINGQLFIMPSSSSLPSQAEDSEN